MMITTYRTKRTYKSCYLQDGMKLERNVGDVLNKRLKKWIEKGYAEVINNNTYVESEYVTEGGADHIIKVGNKIFEIEDKNFKQYDTPQSTAWGELQIIPRFTGGTEKYVITTYENGVFSESLKQVLDNHGIKTLYVGHKTSSFYDNKVRSYLHKKLTPLFMRIENMCLIKQKREDMKALRKRGHKDTDNSKLSVRSLLDYSNVTGYNGIMYDVSTICVEGKSAWSVKSGPDTPFKHDSMRVPRKNTSWEGLI